MDNITPSSPASSLGSDNDAVNTDTARVHFGPFKTPERKYIATSKTLFPPPQPIAARRSPRLSSPRLRSASPMDVQHSEEDARDIEQVTLLVNDSDEDEMDPLNSGVQTPSAGDDVVPDEPSSVLADRIIHALDNPSPPPSPPSTLRIFDPYHATTPEGPTDYHTDLMSLKINDTPETENKISLMTASGEPQPISSLLSTAAPDISANDAPPAPESLITFDSFLTPSKLQDVPNELFRNASNQPTLSVDDLLTQSPDIHITPTQKASSDVSAVTMGSADEKSCIVVESAMLVDDPSSQHDSTLVVVLTAPPRSEGDPCDGTLTPPLIQPESTDSLGATPLRRSTRPRRSITPTPIANPLPPVFTAPPSIARTQVKKKFSTPSHSDEAVSDSQDEHDIRTTIRVRHRSPGKAPLSFRRELGSLSPTSSNVLSTLAFSGPDGSAAEGPMTVPENQAEPSGSQQMFSFSVFAPPVEAPSTPARSTDPVRFSSPPKPFSSSSTFRIQTLAPNDLTNTPARRIPIAQGIAQGHVSPQKAVQLGFSTTGTPLHSVATPARRVPVSDTAAPSLMKSNNLRPASPIKKAPGQRDTSVEPSQRFSASLKGKEKATQEQPAALRKLPFPLVSSKSTTSSSTTPSQEPVLATKTSPVKSTLKQTTSRIPRIGAKPYARVEPKVIAKAAITPVPTKAAEIVKPVVKVVDSASVARKNAREGAKVLAASSSSRIKPVTSSITTTLKRKRESEMSSSPAKPRVIMLRQVPTLATPPIETLSISQPSLPTSMAAKGKKVTPAPVRMRRVVDPESTIVVRPAQKSVPSPEGIIDPPKQQSPEGLSSSPPLPDPSDRAELPPGSPMRQDSADDDRKSSVQNEDITTALGIIDDAATSVSSGLRRTTRSRRGTATNDVFTEGSSRDTSSRRKVPVFRSDDIFSGMSMTALKDLTVSNTVRNQRYIAAKLETEVIRKEGTRPESPAVKIRTIVQRQQEERDRERAARANRRARRSGEDILSSDVEETKGVGGSDEEMSDGEIGGSPIRHTRGAGEDDDYETPDKYKHIKPMRLFEAAGEGQDTEAMRRRVKWDRGLFTTVYLDEVKLGTRQPLKENRALKGILAPTAKALRLDTLGNHPHADSPLGDLVPENIVVKKIVYDSDVAAAVAEVAAAAKSTRSKSKKK